MSEEFETWYARINWYTGEWAGREAHGKVKEFWMNSGRAGAEYLAMRLRDEWHLELLEGVAGLLGDLAPESVDPILDSLDQELKPIPYEYFLKALRWTEEQQDGERVEATIRKFTRSDDPDIRAEAYGATVILPRERAHAILASAFKAETDVYAKSVAMEELEDRFGPDV